MIHYVEPDREPHDNTDRLALVVIFSFAWSEGGGGSQFDLRPHRKKDFNGEGQGLFLRSLDQRGKDGGFLSLGRSKDYDEMGDWRPGREREGPLSRLTLQLKNTHGRFEHNIGILRCNGGEVIGECNASAAETEVGNGAIPRRRSYGNRGR
jgi:hypothetical protein